MEDFKIGDVVYIIQHSVYGNPNGPLNEPFVLPMRICEIEGKEYTGYGTDTFGIYTV